MKLFYSDGFSFPLPPGHRFPIEKYGLIRQKLIRHGIVPTDALHIPDPATDEQLELVHSRVYLSKVINGSLTDKEVRKIGFPWSLELVERSRRSVGGTIAASMAALEQFASANLAGGTHHASAESGEGFCVFNDCAVAARVLQSAGLVSKIIIFDCDVHQGNGTARIFANNDRVTTLSIHAEKNYPFRKYPSDVDIALADNTRDDGYLRALESGFEIARRYGPFDFGLYIAGADPHQGDRLGRLGVSKSGLAERDRRVYAWFRQINVPVTTVLGGGYGKNIENTVEIHCRTIELMEKIVG